jgi:hypothetical protein
MADSGGLDSIVILRRLIMILAGTKSRCPWRITMMSFLTAPKER